MTEYEIHKLIEQQDPETKQRIWTKIQSKLQEKEHKMTLQQIIEKFKSYENCTEYISARGKKCYRISGNLDYYFLLCADAGIDSHWAGDFYHEAHGDGFTLEYVEHDIILAIA